MAEGRSRAEEDLLRSEAGPTLHRPDPAVLADFWENFDEVQRSHDNAVLGVETMTRAVLVERVELGLDPHATDVQPEHQQMLQAAWERAEMARHEKARDFAPLHGSAAVGLWSCLEALVERLFRAAWEFEPELTARVLLDQERRVAPDVPTELVRRFGEEVFEPVLGALAEWWRDVQLRRPGAKDVLRKPLLGYGSERFERSLRLVGLGGQVDKTTDRFLRELGVVRDVIVHRAGRVDRRFLEACDWLGYEDGDLVRVGYTQYDNYVEATRHYGYEIGRRVMRLGGIELEASEPYWHQ